MNPGYASPVDASVGNWYPNDHSGYFSTGLTPTTFIGSAPLGAMPNDPTAYGFMPAIQVTATQ